jgi:hypothetical protein
VTGTGLGCDDSGWGRKEREIGVKTKLKSPLVFRGTRGGGIEQH